MIDDRRRPTRPLPEAVAQSADQLVANRNKFYKLWDEVAKSALW